MAFDAPSFSFSAVALTWLHLTVEMISARKWYSLRYVPAKGASFVKFSGIMTVPAVQRAKESTCFFWSGLQPADGTGVYQNILDGQSGTWMYSSAWDGSDPTLDWEKGFNATEGDQIRFENNRTSSTDWTSTIIQEKTGLTITNSFPIANKSFNEALFAIELYDEEVHLKTGHFPPLRFSDIEFVAEGSANATWCTAEPENFNLSTDYTIHNTRARVSGTTVTCQLESVVLNGPAAPSI